MKKYLFILRQAPYSSYQNLEAIETALALATFMQKVSLLFIENGVLQLLRDQNANLIRHKQFTQAYAGLNLFDIKDVFVSNTALNQFGLRKEDLNSNITIINNSQIATLMQQNDIVITI